MKEKDEENEDSQSPNNSDSQESEESEESDDESEPKDETDSLKKKKIKIFEKTLKKIENVDKKKLQYGLRSSIGTLAFGPTARKFVGAKKFKFNPKRIDKKRNTGLLLDNVLVKEKIKYPLENLRPLPIFISAQKELIYLYLTEEYKDNILYKLNKTKSYAILEDVSLLTSLTFYYENIFNRRGNIEERLRISMSEKMKQIKPNYTIAIEMDEILKNSEIVKQQSAKYLLVKKDILKHLDQNQNDLIKFDPFSKIRIKGGENNTENNKQPRPKWATSLNERKKEMSDEEESEDEFSRKPSEIHQDNKKEEELIEDYLSKKGEENNMKNLKNQNNIKKNDVNEKRESDEIYEPPYKEYIKKLFFPKLDYFRKSIMKKILENSIFYKMSFDKFVCALEFFITLFTGIQVKYTIDELGFLNMDLYADELIYMNMAEILHYQVQFQIRDISHSSNHEHKINPKLIINLNNCQYEDFIENKIEFYPPSTAFLQELSNHFRRYTHNDNYHLCEDCEKLFSVNEYKKVKCDSSVFRFIDKARLLTMTLAGVLNIDYIDKMVAKNSNEENEEEQNNLFKRTMILRNEDVFNEFKITYIIIAYLCPIITKHILKLNNTFRIIFGEIIGYYYTWVSHYISWVIFPAIIGFIAEILLLFINNVDMHNYIYLIFLVIILLWGFYYVRNWKKYEKFCNHIWGMDSFQAEITKIYDENYSKVPYVTFMGIDIPKVDKLSSLMVNFISVVLVFISSLFIMGVNIGIFKVNKMNNVVFKTLHKIFAYFGISKNISKYTLPILIYIAREIISKIFYNISAILAKLERPTDKDEYDEIVTKKRLTLEFVNYYFNLYYIMIYKKWKNKCENDDCFQELKKQLILILISNIFSVISQFIYRIIYLRKNIKNFEIKMKQAYEKNHDYIEKLKFYTRESFTEDNIQQLMIPIIFNFGYVIQFGICCPISFLFVLILIISIRLTDAISMIYVYYVKTLNISKGLLVYNKTQHLLVFAGLFSNLCILFYTKNSASELKLIYKLILIVLVQNGVVVICNIIRFKSLPFWFRYRKIIKLEYLKKFGVIRNRSNNTTDKNNKNYIDEKPKLKSE